MIELSKSEYSVALWSPPAAVIQAPHWYSTLIRSRSGIVKPNLSNALKALTEDEGWRGVLAFNEFTLMTMAISAPPGEEPSEFRPREWTEHDDMKAAVWLQDRHIDVSLETARQAVQTAARLNRIHPVKNYLSELVWDRKPRIDTWLVEWMGAEPSDYTSAVGRRFLIAAVARIFKPGAKVDAMPIFEGPQGIGKSTALRILAGEWFTDQIADLGSKDASVQMLGVWIIEMSELDAMSKKDAITTKAFLSQSFDRFRPHYERHPVTHQRRCVFAGTTNNSAYLKDETGGRRFHPVKVTRCDLAGLREARDQLWAEAKHRYEQGETWWMDTPELVAAAAEEQAERYVSDPWQEKISSFLEGRDEVSASTMFGGECLDIETKFRTHADKARVTRIMRVLKWEQFKKRLPGGKFEMRYRPHPPTPPLE